MGISKENTLSLRPYDTNCKLVAAREGWEIFLSPTTIFSFLRNYFHEIGHIVGDELSFVNHDVLTPQEVRDTVLPLSQLQKLALLVSVGDDKVRDTVPGTRIMEIARLALRTFTKGNFDESRVQLHYGMTEQELYALFSEDDYTPGIRKDVFGNVRFESSREGRNAELSAFTVEHGCMTLLENTLHTLPTYHVLFGQRVVFGSHLRALDIVERAYISQRMILPSMKDLRRVR